MIPFVGFAPDLPPETPGVFTDCKNVLPAVNGFVAAPTSIDAGLGAISSAAQGFAVVKKSDNTTRVFCGNSTKLYEQVAGVWSDKSGSVYGAGPDDRWRFAQFGDVTLATNKQNTIQAITTGSFADASGTAPKAAILEVINNQVFAFNINGMGFGNQPDRWACSALGGYTDWTPSVTTQCVSGQFLDAPGSITAGKRLGDVIVAYKEKAMYVGQYVGAPEIWNWQRVPGDIGAPCQEAVVNTGTFHLFVGPDDFYIFDGTRPTPVQAPIRNWFYANMDAKYAYKICGTYDRVNKRAYWWFPDVTSNGALTKCVVFNIASKQWTKIESTIEYVADYVSAGLTYDTLGSAYSTYDSLPTTISFDSPFWNSGSAVIAAFGTDHKAYQLSGTPGESRIVSHHIGDNTQFSTLSRIRPRFLVSPTSSTMNYSYSNTDGNNSSFTNNITSTYAGKWYDLIWSAQWHKCEFVFQGPTTISGFDPVITPDGIE